MTKEEEFFNDSRAYFHGSLNRKFKTNEDWYAALNKLLNEKYQKGFNNCWYDTVDSVIR